MGLRVIALDGDPVLTKKCKEVTQFDEKLHTLLDDMAETMYRARGVGLAAPQVSVLRRVVVIDVGDGLLELVNPVIISQDGEQKSPEGCLSFPGKSAITLRPRFVTVSAYDRNGSPIQLSGQDLKAKAFCHELDHLDGISFLQKAIISSDKGNLGLMSEGFK